MGATADVCGADVGGVVSEGSVAVGSGLLGSVLVGSVVLGSVVLGSVLVGCVVVGCVVLGSVVIGSVVLGSVFVGSVSVGSCVGSVSVGGVAVTLSLDRVGRVRVRVGRLTVALGRLTSVRVGDPEGRAMGPSPPLHAASSMAARTRATPWLTRRCAITCGRGSMVSSSVGGLAWTRPHPATETGYRSPPQDGWARTSSRPAAAYPR